MTWPPDPAPCRCETCTGTPLPAYEPSWPAPGWATDPGSRYCVPEDPCDHCTPPPVTRAWIDRTDPAPAEPPPDPARLGFIARIRGAKRQ